MRALLSALLAVLAVSGCGASEPDPVGVTGTDEPAALPDVARVVCEPHGARVETPSVRPQRDGVHVEIVNDTGRVLSFSILNDEGGGTGIGVKPGTSAHVVDIEPGAMRVSCTDPAADAVSDVALEVVDEDGVWVSTRLPCPEQVSTQSDYIVGARGETSDPLEAARTAFESYKLEPDDVVEAAGYPDGEVAKVRLVRDDEPVAVAELFDDGAGKWLLGTLTACSSLED
jgi:hypothetical protein